MSDTDRELGLEDEDRLPWLEAVESDDDDEGLSASKLMGFILAALVALGLVIGGIWWLRGQQGPGGDGTLIAAQEGDYKVKPDDPGGMKVEGQGDSAFATSEGAQANGKVDVNAKPETPVAATKALVPAAAAPVAAGAKAVTTAIGASAPAPAPAVGATGPGMIQLGAYGSQVSADQVWAGLSAKVQGLSGLAKSVIPAAVGGGTVYRLRANAGSEGAAGAMCSKVKAAGTPCMIVR
jgi:cell division protein FtsN